MPGTTVYLPQRSLSERFAGPPGAAFGSALPLGSAPPQRLELWRACERLRNRKLHADAVHRHQFRLWSPAHTDADSGGFDDGDIRTMQSLLIPAGSCRQVTRRWRRDARVYSESPDVAEMCPSSGRSICLRGKAPGTTYLHAVTEKDRCWSALQVVVKRHFSVPVVFHRLADSKGHRAKRPASDIPGLIERVNDIFARQTCLIFRDARAGALHNIDVPTDLGEEITIDSGLVQQVRRNASAPAVVHVIFVWKIRTAGAFDDTIGGEMFGDYVFLTDGMPDPGKRLAHEIGHLLTKVHESSLEYSDGHFSGAGLMDPTASSTRITRREAELMYHDVTRRLVRGAFVDGSPASAAS